MTIVFVTGNENKKAEFYRIVGIENIKKYNIRHHKEDSVKIQDTVEKISHNKCMQFVKKITNYESDIQGVICEDVSLEFNALNGLPGPYIKYFINDLGLQKLYNLIANKDDHNAVAICCYTFFNCKHTIYKQFIGKTHGTIVAPRGDNKIGWDEIFQPNGSNLTFAEMSREEKDKYSHRADAINQFLGYIASDHK